MQPADDETIERRKHDGDGEHDEEGELEAGFKQLARLGEQDDEGGEGKGVEEVNGGFERPTAQGDRHNDGGADGERFPAGGGGVEPDERDGNETAPGAGDIKHAQ